MNIAALYARVSTSNQENEKTVNSQIDEIKSVMAKDGVILGDNLSFIDEGWTGSILARPELDRLRDMAKNGVFQVLYVYDLGRLSRVLHHQLVIKDELQSQGVKIVSLHDINGDNTESLLAQNVMSAFHDYERMKIAERFRRGKQYKAKNGILFGWQAPFGYKYTKDTSTGLGRFEINEPEAEMVRTIFNWFVGEKLNIRKLILKLYTNKIFPRKSKNEYWSNSTLSRLLRNETYIGTAHYNKGYAVEAVKPQKIRQYKRVKKTSRRMRQKDEWFPIKVPALVSQELFFEAQEQLKNNSQFCKRNKVQSYLLSSLIHCSCGRTRCGGGSNGHFYYRCTDREIRFPLPKQCLSPSVNSVILDNLVWAELKNLLTNPSLIQQQYQRLESKMKVDRQDGPSYQIEMLKNQLDEHKEIENRFIKAYGDKVITLEQLNTQLDAIKVQKAQIMGKITQSSENRRLLEPLPTLPDLNSFSATIGDLITELKFEERQQVVREVIQDVITDGSVATVGGYIPLEIPEAKSIQNYEQKSINRDRGLAECGQIHTFQRTPQETSSPSGKLPFCYNRAKCGRR